MDPIVDPRTTPLAANPDRGVARRVAIGGLLSCAVFALVGFAYLVGDVAGLTAATGVAGSLYLLTT